MLPRDEDTPAPPASAERQAFRLESLLPRLVLQEPDRRVHPCQGTVLYLRLTGPIALAQALSAGGAAGAEELKRYLGACLESLTDWVGRWGGDTLELNATGLLAFFPDESELRTSLERGLSCALAIREVVKRLGGRPSREGGPSLSSSIGVACGVIHGLLLGQPASGQRVVFIGAALEDAARASLQAGGGQIALHPSAGVRLDPEQVRTVPPLPSPALVKLEALGAAVPPPVIVPRPVPPAPRSFIAPALLEALEKPETLASFRKLSTLTIHVSGVDPAAGSQEALSQWYSRVQQVLQETGGLILELEAGASTRLEVIFGAPRGYPDDEARALHCALTLQRAARDLPSVSDQRIGVATGSSFVGLMGGRMRQQYSALGPRLELSRRLAQQAGPWEVLVDRYTVSRSGFGFDWGPPPPAPDSADMELVTARVLYGEGAFGTKLTSRSRGALLGREELMAQLKEVAEEALSGRGRLVSLVGTAGIGKSALLVWLGQMLQSQRRTPVYRGETSSLVRQAPFFAWMPIFRDWFDLQLELPLEDQISRIEQRVGSLGEDLLPRLPLLGMVTGVPIADTPATRGLDTLHRRDALFALILEMFRRAHREVPLGLIFEDAHWMDEGSMALLRYLARNIADLPIFITVTRRPVEGLQAEAIASLESVAGVVTLPIGVLTPEALCALACRHVGASRLEPDLQRLLVERSGGTPLFLEELTLLLRDTDQIQVDLEGVARLVPGVRLGAPYDIRDVILQRLSRLDEGAQLTLKAASAMGRNFSLSLLQEIYPVPFEFSVLLARLDRVEGLDIVRRDEGAEALGGNARLSASSMGLASHKQPNDAVFFFKHAIIRDTIYETLTASSRRNLHEAIGIALEKRLTPENRAELVLIIAEHFRHTMRTDKQRQYFREAGEIARARALNREASAYFLAAEQLSSLVGDRLDVAELLEALVSVLNLLGDRDAQRDAIARWKEVAQELSDDKRLVDALRAEGALLARSGEPLKALKVLEQARRMAAARGDALQEARVVRIISRTHFQQGDYPRALEAAQQALALIEPLGENVPETVTDIANLGTILVQMRHTDAAREKLSEALRRALELGDVRLAAICLSNLGGVDELEGRTDRAMREWEQALGMKRQVGERHEEGATLNNIGFAYLTVGRFAQALEYFREALAIARQVEERWLTAMVLSNLGQVHAALGSPVEARACFVESCEVAEVCGARQVHAEALEGLARLELAVEDLEAAVQVAQRGYELGRHRRVSLMALLALLKRRQGHDREADELAVMAEAEIAVEAAAGEWTWPARFLLAQAFEQGDQARALRHLEESHAELLQRASRIEDPELRGQLLQAVWENRALIETWERWHEASQDLSLGVISAITCEPGCDDCVG